MADTAQQARQPAPPVRRAAVAPADPLAAGLNASARVRALAVQRAALSGAAPIQLGKDGDKKKKIADGKKKAKEKKVQKLVNSVRGYDTTERSRSEIEKQVRTNMKNGIKMRTGHLSKDSSRKMNDGTKKTNKLLHEQLNEKDLEEKKKKKKGYKAKEEAVIEEVEDIDEFDNDDDYHDKDKDFGNDRDQGGNGDGILV